MGAAPATEAAHVQQVGIQRCLGLPALEDVVHGLTVIGLCHGELYLAAAVCKTHTT